MVKLLKSIYSISELTQPQMNGPQPNCNLKSNPHGAINYETGRIFQPVLYRVQRRGECILVDKGEKSMCRSYPAGGFFGGIGLIHGGTNSVSVRAAGSEDIELLHWTR